jgi:hypothetical protein
MGRGRPARISGTEPGETDGEWRRREELTSLLRACRARLARPAVPGTRGGGIRQEDAAALARVSERSYRTLERAEHPASPKLAGLAEKVATGLRMSPAERSALYVLATGQDPPRPLTAAAPAPPSAPDKWLRHLADQIGRSPDLSPDPAGYIDASWTVLYCNQAMYDWSGGWFVPGGPCRHLICYLFSGHAETVLDGISDLREVAIAALRYQYARNLGAAAWGPVIECVTGGGESGRLWNLHRVAFMPEQYPCRIILPDGEPADSQTLFTPLRPDLWLYTLIVPPGATPPGQPPAETSRHPARGA